jgi:hypothetical protein
MRRRRCWILSQDTIEGRLPYQDRLFVAGEQNAIWNRYTEFGAIDPGFSMGKLFAGFGIPNCHPPLKVLRQKIPTVSAECRVHNRT